MSVAGMATKSQLWRNYACIMLALLAGLHLAVGQFRLADPDEFQALVNAFDAAQGLRPYIDYWDNHGPFAIWLLTPILESWSGDHHLILVLRGLMWLQSLALVAVLFWLTRRLYPHLIAAPWMASLFLLSSPPFIYKAIEIRSDNAANLLAASALGLLIFALKKGNAWTYFAAGLSIGLIAGFTLKFIIIAAALGIFCCGWCWRSGSLPQLSGLMLFGLGIVIPIAGISLVLAANGSFGNFMVCYLGGNINRELGDISSSAIVAMYKKAPVWSILATSVLASTVWRMVRRKADAMETGLSLMVLFLVAQFVFLLPTKNMQSLLPAWFPLGLLAGIVGSRWISERLLPQKTLGHPKFLVFAAILLPLALLRDMDDYAAISNAELRKQIEFANQTLLLTMHESYILDPSGVVFLKSKPGSFHVLVTFVRKMHQSGVVDLKVPQMLEQYNITSIVFDHRTRDLRRSDVQYILENYLPMLKGPDCWLLRRNPASDLPSLKSDSQWKRWAEKALDKTEVPNMEENPPNWFRQFVAVD